MQVKMSHKIGIVGLGYVGLPLIMGIWKRNMRPLDMIMIKKELMN